MPSRSSKQETKQSMEFDKLPELQEKTSLSGSYIRSLVKQLASSRTKDPMDPKHPDSSVDGVRSQNSMKFGEGSVETPQAQQTPHPQQHKKQVRRRLHTSKPYQQRLLNMAEARREIVAALKSHRAAMKQASEQKHRQTQEEQHQQSRHPCFDQDGRIESSRNLRVYPSRTANFPHSLGNLSYTSFSNPPLPPYPFSGPPASPFAPPSSAETLNFTLPTQPLGLNLNFHNFNNLDTGLWDNKIPSLSSSSSSSSSPPSSSFRNVSVTSDQEAPSVTLSRQEVGTPALPYAMGSTFATGGTERSLHAAIDDEEMAEIRLIGEQHQMEWSDSMNLATSAWWFKFLKTMELEGPEVKDEVDYGCNPFDEVLEFPAWLNANDSCLQEHLNDYFCEDFFQDPALPCMDIEEIEGMDGEWLA